MADIIHLLPDAIANQIAAGEVVQRPASVVKELMENSIDAGAKSIKLIIQDAGKKLIQVIDDGKGMSETDARMALERHATSKLNAIEDLYQIATFGFRGEALASIAAVAQVEIKTKRPEDELGTKLIVEGSTLKKHEPCATANGTSIAVKNLFFNTPARKNFLKSNNVEYRHILDEFLHVALAHPELQFIFKNGKEDVYHLNPGSKRQRIVNVLGKKFDNALVPIEEETPLIRIRGFFGKPDFSKKTRGEQYFFVNNRYIRSPYLNHAVMKAFEGLLPQDHYPLYFLYFDMDPSKIDVNVHPTKTEVKFEDEKAIYAILKASIKKSLSQHHIAPSLDFDREEMVNTPFEQAEGHRERINFNTNPAAEARGFGGERFHRPAGKSSREDWEELFKVLTIQQEEEQENADETEQELFEAAGQEVEKQPLQIQRKYILTPIRSGFMIIHQYYAHQRILYENYLETLEKNSAYSQQQLFPEVIELSNQDFQLVKDILPDIEALGFSMEQFGKQAFLLNGVPADVKVDNAQHIFEQLLEDYKHHMKNQNLSKRDNLARSLARHAARRTGATLNPDEMRLLIDKLFACQMPYYTPEGKPVFITISMDELDKKFEKGNQ